MKTLTDREQNIVLATIRLWNVNDKKGFVPDYELLEPVFGLSMETMRDVRDLVQEVQLKSILGAHKIPFQIVEKSS
jgi:hypothetical protein